MLCAAGSKALEASVGVHSDPAFIECLISQYRREGNQTACTALSQLSEGMNKSRMVTEEIAASATLSPVPDEK
jgi:hypothetical protein